MEGRLTRSPGVKRIEVITNLFSINYAPKSRVFLYDIQFSPDPERPGLMRKLFDIASQSEQLRGVYFAYDGGKVAFTHTNFGPLRVVVRLPTRGRAGQFDRGVEVAFNGPVREMSLEQIERPQMQALDIVFGQSVDPKLRKIGRSYFNEEDLAADRGNDMIQIWEGFFQALRVSERGLLLNLDLSLLGVFRERNIIDHLEDALKSRDLSRIPPERLLRALRGLKLHVKHLDRRSKPLVVTSIHNESAAEMLISVPDLGSISVERYFFVKYKLQLRRGV